MTSGSGKARALVAKASKSNLALAGCYLLVIIVFSALSSTFRSADNVTNILTAYSHVAIVAVGMMFPIILRGIDLSVGAIVGVTGMAAFDLLLMFDLPGALVIPMVLALGALAGAINGLFIVKLNINPFIATLATLASYRGLTYAISGRQLDDTLTTAAITDSTYLWLDGSVGPLPMGFVYLIFIAVAAWFVLNRTKLGRDIYSVGGNERAAYLAGIDVGRVKLIAYVISGLTASVAALLLTARTTTSPESLGETLELSAIAAAVIGGISLQGGVGGPLGPVIGAFLIGTIYVGMTLERVNPYNQPIVAGVILLGAIAYDRFTRVREDRALRLEQSVRSRPEPEPAV